MYLDELLTPEQVRKFIFATSIKYGSKSFFKKRLIQKRLRLAIGLCTPLIKFYYSPFKPL